MMGRCWQLGVFFLIMASSSAEGLLQVKLDYMSRYLQVTYQVLDNLQDSATSFSCQITLNNTGRKSIPGTGWALFFSHTSLVEPLHYPYPNAGRLLKRYNVRFRHMQGGIFSMEPSEGFGDLVAGDSRVINFTSEASSVARTDAFPNWYLAGPGLEPRTVVNTAGEGLDWVGPFATEKQWRRFDSAEGKDRYEPFSPEARYEANEVEDLGGPGKHVLPTPADLRVSEDSHVQLNTKDWVVFASNKFPKEERMLAERLGIPMSPDRPASHVIHFKSHDPWWSVGEKEIGGPEAYTLIVDPASQLIEIKAHSAPGAFYAVMSLFSLMDDQFRVPESKVIDAPRYKYRGLMLDVARNFRPVGDVLELLEVMGRYKLNNLHLHLTDDQAWRLQVPGLEELTQVGSQRCHDMEGTQCLLPFLGSGPTATAPGSGFYTVEDYQTILRHAADRYIQVIPEVEMPGHAHAAIRAMEVRRQRLQVAKNDAEAKRYVLTDDSDQSWYLSSQLFTDNAMNPCLDSTYEFIAHVLRSLVEMHRDVMPLQIFHVGGQGVAEGAWTNSSACQTLLSSDFDFRAYKDVKEYFVRKVSDILNTEGVNMAAWEGGVMKSGSVPYERARLPNDKVFAYAWNNVWEEGGAETAYRLANAGYKVIMAQATHLFFDHPYEPDPEERGVYWATRFTPARKTFAFMPSDLYANADVSRSGDPLTPEMLCGKNRRDCVELKEPRNIVGIQGHLWSEVVRTKEQADYMLFPRLLALAERAWHKPLWEEEGTDNVTRQRELAADWSAFANTLGYREMTRLDRLGVEYRVPPPGAKLSGGMLTANVPFPGLEVEYSMDNGDSWCQVSAPVPVDPSSAILLRTRSAGGGRYSRTVVVKMTSNSAGRAYSVTSLVPLCLLSFFVSLGVLL